MPGKCTPTCNILFLELYKFSQMAKLLRCCHYSCIVRQKLVKSYLQCFLLISKSLLKKCWTEISSIQVCFNVCEFAAEEATRRWHLYAAAGECRLSNVWAMYFSGHLSTRSGECLYPNPRIWPTKRQICRGCSVIMLVLFGEW